MHTYVLFIPMFNILFTTIVVVSFHKNPTYIINFTILVVFYFIYGTDG